VHKKGIALDGSNPAVLRGYGGPWSDMTPGYRRDVIPFLEAGGVYAIAAVRGGREYGDEWEKAGSGANKRNTVADFIAAAEHLQGVRAPAARRGPLPWQPRAAAEHLEGVRAPPKITSKTKLLLDGRSQGGKLVMDTVVARPDLVAGAVSDRGVHDMEWFDQWGGGPYWKFHYGDPAKPEDSRSLHRQSFFTRVRKPNRKRQTFPRILVIAGLHDDRVPGPPHGYRAVAELQHLGHPARLLVTESGHAPTSAPLKRYVEEEEHKWGFIFDVLGMSPAGKAAGNRHSSRFRGSATK
jgi:prolyl oligopeptidase